MGTGLIGLAAYLLLGIVMPFLEKATAMMSSGILSFFGTASSQGSIVIYNILSVQVIPLCVGDIEIAVLTGAILSTADRNWDDRILGVAGAFIFGKFNCVMMAMTEKTLIYMLHSTLACSRIVCP